MDAREILASLHDDYFLTNGEISAATGASMRTLQCIASGERSGTRFRRALAELLIQQKSHVAMMQAQIVQQERVSPAQQDTPTIPARRISEVPMKRNPPDRKQNHKQVWESEQTSEQNQEARAAFPTARIDWGKLGLNKALQEQAKLPNVQARFQPRTHKKRWWE